MSACPYPRISAAASAGWQPAGLDRTTGPLMFWASILFMVFFSLMLHLELDPQDSGEWRWEFARLAASIYWIFPAEAALYWLRGDRLTPGHWLGALLPMFRSGARDHEAAEYIWLPLSGWRKVDSELEKYLAVFFRWPMVVIAILVVPIVAVELLAGEVLEENLLARRGLEVLTAVIWVAFTLEFILMISVTPKKMKYVLKHWLEILVIALPMLAFLRTARLGRLARLKDLSKTVRAYRTRGLYARWWRAIVALELLDRVQRLDLDNYLANLEDQFEEKKEELTRIEQKLEQTRKELAAKQASTSTASAPQANPTPLRRAA